MIGRTFQASDSFLFNKVCNQLPGFCLLLMKQQKCLMKFKTETSSLFADSFCRNLQGNLRQPGIKILLTLLLLILLKLLTLENGWVTYLISISFLQLQHLKAGTCNQHACRREILLDKELIWNPKNSREMQSAAFAALKMMLHSWWVNELKWIASGDKFSVLFNS